MRRSATPLLLVLLVVIIATAGVIFLATRADTSDSDDTTGTDPTDPVDDIVTPPEDPPPTEPLKAELIFYVILDGRGVTGATCRAEGPETATATTSDGYAKLSVEKGYYDVKVTYGSLVKTRRGVYVGDNGAHVEVVWTSSTTTKGVIKVYCEVDSAPVQAQVEILSAGSVVASGSSIIEYRLSPGTYTVKVRFESTQTFTGQRSVEVKAGEVTIVSFSWAGDGLIDFRIIQVSIVGIGASAMLAAAARRGAVLGG